MSDTFEPQTFPSVVFEHLYPKEAKVLAAFCLALSERQKQRFRVPRKEVMERYRKACGL